VRSVRSGFIGCALLLLLLVGASSANASVTIGPALPKTPPSSSEACGGAITATFSNASLAPATGLASSPIDGVVVRWRAWVEAGSSQPGPSLRIVRSTGAGTFTGAGTSAQVAPYDGAGGPFATRLPIKAGDRIGIELSCEGMSGPGVGTVSESGDGLAYWNPGLVDGAMPGSAPFATAPATGALVNADVEPDADGDGFGDETQDFCDTDAATQGPCLSPGSLTLSGNVPQSVTVSNTSPVTALPISSITASPGFAVTSNSCGASIPAHASCLVGVAFEPTAGGTLGGALTIAAVTGSPRVVALTGGACIVPKLKGKKLAKGRKALKRGDCLLGKAKGRKRGRVRKQEPKPGTVLALGSKVSVKLK
jgi:hypothetical protein